MIVFVLVVGLYFLRRLNILDSDKWFCLKMLILYKCDIVYNSFKIDILFKNFVLFNCDYYYLIK